MKEMRPVATRVKLLLLGPIFAVLLAGIVPHASGMPIDITSSSYHVWGGISGSIQTSDPSGGTEIDLLPFHQTYNETSSNIPISRDMSFPIVDPPPILAQSTTDIMAVGSNTVAHWFIPDAPFPVGDDWGYAVWLARSEAFAEATWTFTPLENNLDLIITGEVGFKQFWGGVISLVDLTMGMDLFKLSVGGWGTFRDWEIDRQIGDTTFSIDTDALLDPGHSYLLALSVGSDAADDGNSISLRATATSVPEPSSLLLLLASGLAAVGGMAWRRGNQAAA
jgi:hypothetical protein